MSVRDMLMAAAGVDTGGGTDDNFENVTLLLNGDGTNGAQNNTFVDSSTNNFTITRNGNTTQGSFSPYGSLWSNYFNGSSNLIYGQNSAFELGTGDFTIECWVQGYVYNENRGLICYRDSGGSWSQGAWMLLDTNGGIGFYTYQGGFIVTATIASTNVNLWNHVAFVRQSGVMKAYINGVLSETNSSSNASQSFNGNGSPQFRVGSQYDNSGEHYYNGVISNLRIVKSAVYTSAFTPSTTPLTAISNTTFLSCQSNRFIDNSSNNLSYSSANGGVIVQRFSPFNPTASYSTATIGGSAYYDGNGDYLSAASNSAWSSGTNDFTYETWIYPTAPSTNLQSIVNFRSGNINNFEIRMDSLQLQLHWDGNLIFNGSTNAKAYSWNHVALVRSSGTITMYLNGVSIGSTGTSYNFNQYTTAYFGGYGGGGASWAYYGYMSNTRFVNGTAVYTSSFTPPTSPLTAITNTAILLNFTNAGISDSAMMNDLETVGNAQVSTSVKKFGTGSLYFDGNGDWLKSTDGSLNVFGTGDFTIEGWAYTASYGSSTQQLVAKGGSGSSSGWYVAIRSTGKLEFGKPTTPVLTSSASVGTNAWFYFTVTRSNGTIYLFINGTLDSTTSDTTNYNDTSNTYVAVFGDGSSQPLTGYIDDLRITKGYARYTATFTPPTAALPVK